MRKQAFDATEGYRAQFLHAEDIDLYLCIMDRWRAANLAEVVVRRRLHSKQISVSHVRQQLFSIYGAVAVASARQRDSVEPPFAEPVITEGVLEKLGVSQITQQQALFSYYSFWVGEMSGASQDDAVVRLVDELIDLPRTGPAGRITVANALLTASQSHYRRGRPFRALVSLGRALLTRPVVAGRPLRRAINSHFGRSRATERPVEV